MTVRTALLYHKATHTKLGVFLWDVIAAYGRDGRPVIYAGNHRAFISAQDAGVIIYLPLDMDLQNLFAQMHDMGGTFTGTIRDPYDTLRQVNKSRDFLAQESDQTYTLDWEEAIETLPHKLL